MAVQVEFEDFWRNNATTPLAGRDWLLARMCPGLAGMSLVKLAMALTLLGGVGHTDATGMKVRARARASHARSRTANRCLSSLPIAIRSSVPPPRCHLHDRSSLGDHC